jgi:hypothetical protein
VTVSLPGSAEGATAAVTPPATSVIEIRRAGKREQYLASKRLPSSA